MRIAAAILVLASLVCLAQPPAFEVASVRLADQSATYRPPTASPDSFTVRNMTLRDCIQTAYEMPRTNVTGPEWLNDVRLDIVAKASGPADDKRLHLMLRTLLAERLALKVHIDRKEMSVYAVTVAKGGPKFSESTTEGAPVFAQTKAEMNLQRVSASELALILTQAFGRPVVDATGLKGRYDIHLDMTPFMNNPGSEDIVDIMMTALKEQMGLRVESRKEAIDILVVDHAEKTPTEN